MTKNKQLLLTLYKDIDSTLSASSKKNLPPPPSLADRDVDGPWCSPGKEDWPRSRQDFQSLVSTSYGLWREEEWVLVQGLGMIWGCLYVLTCLVGVIKFLVMREG